MSLPSSGSVLGIDVGCSPTRRSSAVCRLDWNTDTVRWTIERFRAAEPERTETIARLVDRPLLAAAIDGPLRRGFDEIGAYRLAERLLTLGFVKRIGKPGQSNSPVGRTLNAHANACASAVAATAQVASATHAQAIHDSAIVEAFPSAWLGMLLAVPEALGASRGDRSDRFYAQLAEQAGLARVVAHLLPGRAVTEDFRTVTNHDDRAALVCALTALGLAAGDYAAVGGEQGWIVLPPPALIRPWVKPQLAANAERCGGGVVLPTTSSEPVERHASCPCGQLSLVTRGEPVRVSACHCLDCQRRSGSAFAVQARFPAEAVTVTGEARKRIKVAGSGNSADFHFCPDCGTTMFYHSRPHRALFAIPVGTFADPHFPPPHYSIYESRRHPWLVVSGAGIEHHD